MVVLFYNFARRMRSSRTPLRAIDNWQHIHIDLVRQQDQFGVYQLAFVAAKVAMHIDQRFVKSSARRKVGQQEDLIMRAGFGSGRKLRERAPHGPGFQRTSAHCDVLIGRSKQNVPG